jgi:hypothetical protein
MGQADSAVTITPDPAPPGVPVTPDAPKTASDYVSDFGKHFARGMENLAAPFIKASAPNVALQIWRHIQGQPNTLKEIPENAVQSFLMSGGFGEEVPPESKSTSAPEAAAPAKAADVLEHPGLKPWVNAAKAEIMKVPGANLLKTAYDSARGFAEGTPTPPAAPTPGVPETNGIPWGTRGPGPLDLRGKMIPQTPVYPGAPLPEHPGTFPGAPLPATPPTEVLQANALSKATPQPPPEAAALKTVPPPAAAAKPITITPDEVPATVAPGEEPIRTASGESTPHTLSGDSALRQVLTHQPNKTLLQIARSRGIDVTKEAQLRPDLATPKVINKIVEDYSGDELDDFGSRYMETQRMGWHGFGDISKEATQTLYLQNYFPELKIAPSLLNRTAKAIANASGKSAPTLEITLPAGQTEADLSPLLQESLKRARAARAARMQPTP